MQARVISIEWISQGDMALLTLVDGSVELRDQLKDYKYRGGELEAMSFLDFMLETYEAASEGEDSQAVIETAMDEIPHSRAVGRPASKRIPYREEAGKGKRSRIIRQAGHETLPRFVGRWFCRSDNDAERDFFRASMLMLLKPWRMLHELKERTETFEAAYEAFMLRTDEKCKRVVANVEYYFECSDGAKAERIKAHTDGQMQPSEQEDINGRNVEHVDSGGDLGEGHMALLQEITDEDIERALLMRTHPRERLYGESAVALGYDFGFFDEEDFSVACENTARKAQPEERIQIGTWEAQLKAITRDQMKTTGMIQVTEEGEGLPSSVLLASSDLVTVATDQNLEDRTLLDHERGQKERPQLGILNEEQRRAHDIIEERLKEHITSE